jgi:Fe-S cluster biosynthesis and repair protein YggX
MVLDQKLLELRACDEARIWAQGKTWKKIFETCHRGDWLLWLFKKTMPDDEEHLKLLTRAKAHCALTVRHLMKDQRSITACEVALKFADGKATRDELKAARTAAAAAADAAYAAAADAADAAYAAVASKTKNQKETADICRKYLPIEIWKI